LSLDVSLFVELQHYADVRQPRKNRPAMRTGSVLRTGTRGTSKPRRGMEPIDIKLPNLPDDF